MTPRQRDVGNVALFLIGKRVRISFNHSRRYIKHARPKSSVQDFAYLEGTILEVGQFDLNMGDVTIWNERKLESLSVSMSNIGKIEPI